MTDTKYNGWTNYQTWSIALWLDNDQGSQEYMVENAELALENAEADEYFTKEERATLNLADFIREHIEENNPLADEANEYSDLLSWVLGTVDYYEIAEHYIEDLQTA